MTRGSGINNLEGDKANTHHTHHRDNHNEPLNLGPRDRRRLGRGGGGFRVALAVDRTKGLVWYIFELRREL